MPSFISNFFKKEPKINIISCVKQTHDKSVGEVLGSAYEYKKCFSAKSPLCRKFLTFLIQDSGTENLLFLLACEKFKLSPNRILFSKIYDDFIDQGEITGISHSGRAGNTAGFELGGAKKQVNVPSQMRIALDILRQDPDVPIPANAYDNAIQEITALLGRDSVNRFKTSRFHGNNQMNTIHSSMLAQDINFLQTEYSIILFN